MTVSLLLSTDGGTNYSFACAAVSGDVGPEVLPGLARHILWDAAADRRDSWA